jgi:hypothetical protein
VRRVVDVKAVTHRADALYQDIFVGHRDNWVLGSFPKEGGPWWRFNRLAHISIFSLCLDMCVVRRRYSLSAAENQEWWGWVAGNTSFAEGI